MSKFFLVLVSVLLSFQNGHTQCIELDTKLCDSCSHALFLDFNTVSFLKNNEYNNNFTKGFTGIGVFMEPTLGYFISKNTKLSLGVFLLKYSGRNNFNQAIPTIRLQQKLGQKFDLIFGRIYGTVNHNLLEPLFRFDHYYQDNVEYGIQLIHNGESYISDLWLNWQKFILQDDPFQEKFELGYTSEYIINKGFLEWTIPIQLLLTHKGGQIDTSSNPAVSLLNTSMGFKVTKVFTDDKKLGFSLSYLNYRGYNLPEQGPNSELFENGNGILTNISYSYKDFRFQLGYWSSQRFIAPNGEFLYHSVSEFDDLYAQENRSLISTKIGKVYKFLDAAKMELRADGYYDLDSQDLSYSFGLYFLLNESIFITKVK